MFQGTLSLQMKIIMVLLAVPLCLAAPAMQQQYPAYTDFLQAEPHWTRYAILSLAVLGGVLMLLPILFGSERRKRHSWMVSYSSVVGLLLFLGAVPLPAVKYSEVSRQARIRAVENALDVGEYTLSMHHAEFLLALGSISEGTPEGWLYQEEGVVLGEDYLGTLHGQCGNDGAWVRLTRFVPEDADIGDDPRLARHFTLCP